MMVVCWILCRWCILVVVLLVVWLVWCSSVFSGYVSIVLMRMKSDRLSIVSVSGVEWRNEVFCSIDIGFLLLMMVLMLLMFISVSFCVLLVLC